MASSGDGPVSSSSGAGGEWKLLLQLILGEEEGAAVAASLGRREVVVSPGEEPPSRREIVINVPGDETCQVVVNVSPEGQATASSKQHDTGVVTEEPASVLHAVAAAGDSERHLRCASEIHGKAGHLLTTAAPRSKGDTPLHCTARQWRS